jgi:hypothetical protein
MAHDQIRAGSGGSELSVRLLELRHQELADDHLAAACLIHHPVVERLVGRVEIGPDVRVLDARELDFLSINVRRSDDRRMAARL